MRVNAEAVRLIPGRRLPTQARMRRYRRSWQALKKWSVSAEKQGAKEVLQKAAYA